MLSPQDSPMDLVLRGFSQDEILARTGVDVGYHGRSLRDSAKGVDRFEYKVQHVRDRVVEASVLAAIAAYAEGASKTTVLERLGLSGANIVTLKRLFVALGRAEEFGAADRAGRRGKMVAGMLAKYGVENPFELAEFQEQAEQTRLERYGGRYTFSAGSTLAKRARATLTEHMADKSFAEDLRVRKAATTLERYGVEHPSQSSVVQDRARTTSRERYGVDHASQRPEARARQANLTRADGKRRVAKARQTNLMRYGVEHSSQLPENRIRQSELSSKTYAERSEKARASTQEKYGVDYPSQREERRKEFSLFMKANAAAFVARSRQTSLQRYGVVNHAQTEERRKSQSRRMLDPRHQQRINAAKRANSSFSASAVEETLYALLIERFGENEVLRQYSEPRYPYLCDFYVPSRDLFIELNGLWTHGGHWFDEEDPRDRQLVQTWESRSTAYYDTAIVQWCKRDTAKRDAAGIAQLNYVAFWDGTNLDDGRLWLAMGTPDGCDWERQYSWLPVRALSMDADFPPANERSHSEFETARAANWRESYRRELALWEDNRGTRWGSVQAFLYSNCYRLLGKLPDELSDLEILTSFSTSGLSALSLSSDQTDKPKNGVMRM